jgi:hypothetical protein
MPSIAQLHEAEEEAVQAIQRFANLLGVELIELAVNLSGAPGAGAPYSRPGAATTSAGGGEERP